MALAPPPPSGDTQSQSEGSEIITSPGPFEGPEKLLEIWFAPSADSLPVSQPASTIHINGNGNGNGNANGESSTSPLGGKSRGEGYRGLRTIPRAVWEEMLDIVKCKVLSVVEGDEIDAYLLRYVPSSVLITFGLFDVMGHETNSTHHPPPLLHRPLSTIRNLSSTIYLCIKIKANYKWKQTKS